MKANRIDNNIHFQAKLVPTISVTNEKRMRNIERIFAQYTEKFPEDTMYLSHPISPSFENYNLYFLNKKQIGEYYSTPIHVLENIDTLMTKYNDNKIAHKLIKMFKCLKEEIAFDEKTKKIAATIANIDSILKQNVLNMHKYQQNPEYAKSYEALARINRKKISSLEEAYLKEQGKLATRLEKITKNDPDLYGISEIYK